MTPPDTATNPSQSSAGISLGQSVVDPRQVLADRVEQLYSQMPIAIGATIIAGAFATWELQGRWLTELVSYWGAIVFAYSVASSKGFYTALCINVSLHRSTCRALGK